ncbi:hypothetical protein PMAYCL1PPCAC_11973, partial [Pristionchus mayeri]
SSSLQSDTAVEAAMDMIRKLKGLRFVPSRNSRKMEKEPKDKRRSMSAGDLETPLYEVMEPEGADDEEEPGPVDEEAPGPAEKKDIKPGKKLPAHPDDADKVPVEFLTKRRKDGSVVKVLNPHSAAAKEMMLKGDDTEGPPEMLHLTQPWFFAGMERTKAEAILFRLGFEDGTFLVRQSRFRMVLSLVYLKEVLHYIIHRFICPISKTIRYTIESNTSYSSVYKLVTNYCNEKGFVLPVVLGSPITRVLFFRRSSDEAIKLYREDMERLAKETADSKEAKDKSMARKSLGGKISLLKVPWGRNRT